MVAWMALEEVSALTKKHEEVPLVKLKLRHKLYRFSTV